MTWRQLDDDFADFIRGAGPLERVIAATAPQPAGSDLSVTIRFERIGSRPTPTTLVLAPAPMESGDIDWLTVATRVCAHAQHQLGVRWLHVDLDAEHVVGPEVTMKMVGYDLVRVDGIAQRTAHGRLFVVRRTSRVLVGAFTATVGGRRG